MKKLFVVFILVFAVAGFFWWQSVDRPSSVQVPASATISAPAEMTKTTAAPDTHSAVPTVTSTQVPEPTPDFKEWMAQEAMDLDRLDIDAEEKRAQLKKRLAEISPAQASELLETIKNPKSAAREKILSTYLLVEGGARTQAELTELIIAPLRESPDFAPHSEEEMKGIREKSLRIMAIDGLFSRAQVDPAAKAALARAASEAADPSVRSYASNKLRQLR